MVKRLVKRAALRTAVLELSDHEAVELWVLSELQVTDFAFGEVILKHFIN